MSERFWFRCPSCGEARQISADEAHAREQIQCGCGFKRTGLVTPLLSDREPLPHVLKFAVERDRRRNKK